MIKESHKKFFSPDRMEPRLLGRDGRIAGTWILKKRKPFAPKKKPLIDDLKPLNKAQTSY